MKLVWTTPRTSKNYQTVRNELIKRGHSGDAWDKLAFSLSMLPNLLSHGKALERAREMLDHAVFASAERWATGDWFKQLPRWRKMLDDWPAVRKTLAGRDSFLDPRRRLVFSRPRANPLRLRGMEVTPLVTTLLVRHDYCFSEVPEEQRVSAQFDVLQAMLMAAYINFKWCSGHSVEEYLDWRPDARHEFAPFPIESDKACRTVRWLSEAPQTDQLHQLPDSDDPWRFVRAIPPWTDRVTPTNRDLNAPAAETEEDVRRRTYPSALFDYFEHWRRSMAGWELPESRDGGGAGGGGDGGGSAVDGYIPPDTNAEDLNQKPSAPDPDAESHAEDRRLSERFIAPADLRRPVLPLVQAADIDRAMSRSKWNEMRSAMASTVMPFDLRYLAPFDADRLARHLRAAGTSARHARKPDIEEVEEALVSLLTLSLGRAPADVVRVRLGFVTADSIDGASGATCSTGQPRTVELGEAVDLPLEGPLLLALPEQKAGDAPSSQANSSPSDASLPDVHLDGHPASALPQAIAFVLPSIKPKLSGSSTSNVPDSAVQKQTVRNIIIPAGTVGQLLVDHWHRCPVAPELANSVKTPVSVNRALGSFATPPDDDPARWGAPLLKTFDSGRSEAREIGLMSDPPTIEDPALRVLRFLNGPKGCAPPPGYADWSISLLQGQLAAHIESNTADKTAAWLICGEVEAAAQARLYYTQHSLAHLADAWFQAMRTAGLSMLTDATKSADLEDSVAVTKGAPPIQLPQSSAVQLPPTLKLPAYWPWSDPALHDWKVGAPFVAPFDEVRRLVQTLQRRLEKPPAIDRRSALRDHHRDFLLFTLVHQGLSTGLRAVRSPMSLLRAVEQSDRIRKKAGLPASATVLAGLADKESYYNQRARLVELRPSLVKQLRALQAHQIALVVRLDRVNEWQDAPPRVKAMFRLGDRDCPAEVTVAWVEQVVGDNYLGWSTTTNLAG